MDTSIENTDPGEATQNSVRSFAELDEIVRKGKATFHEVTEALTEIHDRQLYKEQYGTWANYLGKRFGISRQRAHQLMKALKWTKCQPVVDKTKSERQIRAIAESKRRSSKPAKLPNVEQPKVEPSKVDINAQFDLDTEFEAFEQTLERWEDILSRENYREALFHEDYRELRDRIVNELENIIIALEDEDEEVA